MRFVVTGRTSVEALIGLAALALGSHGGPPAWAAPRTRGCHAAAFTVTVAANDRVEKTIGSGLTFRLEPQALGPDGGATGWQMTIVPSRSPTEDYIHPVNPPLRFNGVQIFGPSYGDDVEASLSHVHEVRFLLRAADYDRIAPLLTNALWPYSAPRPDAAADEYTTVLKGLTTGRLAVTVVSYETTPDTDSLRRMTLRAELTTPGTFTFAPGLKPRPTSCPRTDE
jgi:hypothetical protein